MPELFFRWMDLDLPKNEEAGRQQDWRAAAQVCSLRSTPVSVKAGQGLGLGLGLKIR